MFEMMLLNKGNGSSNLPHPVGQVSFNVPGSYNWTVPEGVTTINVACLGPGAHLPSAVSFPRPPGNAGGGVVYLNNVRVSPGQIIPLVVGTPGWSNGETMYTDATFTQFQEIAVSFMNRARIPARAASFQGGSGGAQQKSGWWYLGGSAAHLEGHGRSGDQQITPFIADGIIPGGWDKDLTVYTQPSKTTPRGLYGVGATINQYAQYEYMARPGIVRIIWGNNRGYPSSMIDNQPVITMEDILAGG